jgi:hypothetical protein
MVERPVLNGWKDNLEGGGQTVAPDVPVRYNVAPFDQPTYLNS